MKVIFLRDLPGTADAGDVKDVKNGFARNYLIPRSLALPATKNHLQRIAAIQKTAEERRQKEAKEMRVVAQKVEGSTVVLERKVGPTGRLYGSITSRHVAQEASKLVGENLDHRAVLIPQPIHEPGDYTVTLRLHRDVSVEVFVSVVPEGFQQQEDVEEEVVEEEVVEEEVAEEEKPVSDEEVQE